MSYAVLQQELEPPTLTQLKQACRSVHGLTEMDAYNLARNAGGILLRGSEMAEAQAFQAALTAQGVSTTLVEEATLPPLPQSKNVTILECKPEALIIYDPYNRPVPVKWNDLMLVAAGKVPLQEFNTIRTEIDVPQYHTDLGGRGYVTLEKQVDFEHREERHERFLLEIVVRGPTRYSVNADKSLLLFKYLGNRKTDNLLQNFQLLIQDMAQFSPDVAVNRGAYYLREGSGQSFDYPSKTSFYSEIIWLLWQLSKSG